jgi:hypothetical protein
MFQAMLVLSVLLVMVVWQVPHYSFARAAEATGKPKADKQDNAAPFMRK